VLAAFVKAFQQLADPALRRVLWVSMGIAALLFVALWATIGWLLTNTTLFQTGWMDTAVDVLGGLATLILSWLLFPAVVSTTTGFFLDRAADAVEHRHYPHLAPAREQPLQEVAMQTAKFFAVLIPLNLVALLFLLVPPLFPFVFLSVNGYLLGREYFELVAARRLDPQKARTLRQNHTLRLFAVGVLIALLLTIPIVNLLAPLIGTAAMVHVFHALKPPTGPRA
jgi:CysZ protein